MCERTRRPLAATRLGLCDEPLERDVDVVLLLAGDGVAADLPVLDRRQIPEGCTDKGHCLSAAALLLATKANIAITKTL